MRKKLVLLLLLVVLALTPAALTQAQGDEPPKPKSPPLSDLISTTTSKWEWVDTPEGPHLELVTTVAQSQFATISTDPMTKGFSLARSVTFTMWRAIEYYYDWSNRPHVRGRGKSTVSVTADEVYIFIWQFYGNPGNCTNGVRTAQKTEYYKKQASCSTAYTLFGHNLQHCIRNAQHHAKVYGDWMFWYDNQIGPFVTVP